MILGVDQNYVKKMSKNKYMLEFCEYSSKLLSRIHELNQRAKSSDCYTVNLNLIKKGLSFSRALPLWTI